MNITDIDLKSLEVLDVLLKERNVTRTAKRVGLSQPAVSNALARLRRFFEDPLLIRTRTGMVPTSRAEQLVGPLHEAITLLEATLDPPAPFAPQETHQLFKIAATDYAEWLLVPQLCQLLEEQAPGARLEVDPLRNQIPLGDLERGEIDLAIGYFPDPPTSLFQKELFKEDFVCAVGPNFPHKKNLSLETFVSLKHLLVAPWGGMASLVDSVLAQQKLKRTVSVSTSRFLVAPHIVLSTNYVVTLPRKAAQNFAKFLPIHLIEHPMKLPTLTFRQIWHRRTHHEPPYKWFRNQVAEVAKTRKN